MPIHATAIVDARAELAADVAIGPYVVIEGPVRLGARTATDDAEGEVVARSDRRPTDAAIAAALPAFEGEIAQVPPQFSAVRFLFRT